MKTTLVHGTIVSYAGIGILITGPSGAGKSLLALDLISGSAAHGPAFLVADDQVALWVEGSGLWARAPAPLSGSIELRGRGIVHRPVLAQARVLLNIVLADDVARMPEANAFEAEWLGVTVAAAPIASRARMDMAHQRLLVDEAVAGIIGRSEKMT